MRLHLAPDKIRVRGQPLLPLRQRVAGDHGLDPLADRQDILEIRAVHREAWLLKPLVRSVLRQAAELAELAP